MPGGHWERQPPRGGTQGGVVVTKPVKLGHLADRLTLNYRADRGGHVRVGLYHPDGKPVPGYSLQECKALTGNQINQTVMWKIVYGNTIGETNGDLRLLRGKHPVVRIRFELRDADLFSLQFQPWSR